ncbi:hypothetical protein GG804_13105 [Sphingomonas histidinilytica]|uniref:hypothetical protein n=1 Tax=Rhizorhabdus histidinilytica TaxID=439228 RepID=UPI001ADC611E|nr:hypothetical protein [Rhizorhabdus histidinilytica]MBO9377708.1 hypothetical protein [Rhizorhabdus histidinilytica]
MSEEDEPMKLNIPSEFLDEIFAPFQRVQDALRGLDARAAEILALHAAVEREMDLALARSLPHADRLRKLGFGQKLSVLAAATNLDQSIVDRWLKPAIALNELRNAIAHGDGAAQITKLISKLRSTLTEDRDASIVACANTICGRIHGLSGPSTSLQRALLKQSQDAD